MHPPCLARRSGLSRRAFLRGAGFTLSLPFLEAMQPAFASAAEAAAAAAPRRMVCIQTNMGIMPQFFFPSETGSRYTPPAYLQTLAAHRSEMTVFSGVSHPGVAGGHAAEKCFLTAYETVAKIDGVVQATASFKEGKVTALIDPAKTNQAALEEALKKKQVTIQPPLKP